MRQSKEYRKAYSAGYLAGRLKNKEYHKKFVANGVVRTQIKRGGGYDREIKNIVRDKIISTVLEKKAKTILTLESENFLFAKRLKESKIFVYENNPKTYKLMKDKKPNNVVLFNDDVSSFTDLDKEVDCVYLDFCSTLVSNEERLYQLSKTINSAKLFAVTFCIFPMKEDNSDSNYQFTFIRRLQEITGVPWKILYGKAYKDTGHLPMVTIVMENPSK